jgi:NAD+ synthase/NAD+ synthase (glutamine-hydrolysing)
MKLAIAQLNPTVGDLAGNARLLLEAAEQASQQGARLLLTPELSLCGYPPRDLLLNPDFIERCHQTLEHLARQLPPSVAVLVGVPEGNPEAGTTGGKPLFNSLALLLGGQVLRFFRKRLLPTYDVFDEDRYFAPGQSSNVLELRDGDRPLRLGISICEDLWNNAEFWGQRYYPQDPVADLAAEQVDLILNASASPYRLGKQHLREDLLSHTARRHGIPILYANQVGGNDDLIFDGCSLALDAQGTLQGRAHNCQSDLLLLDWTSGQLKSLTPPQPLPSEDAEELWQALVLGIRDYARKCGFERIVLGLSGGIDSALVATLTAAAVGPDNVLGVLMPSPYSSEHSVTDAQALIEALGIQSQIIPIAPLMASFERSLADCFDDHPPGVTEENLQSRIRGTLLMALSNKFGHLLVTTGNKSELAVGYCTLYGDMNGGLAAIADLPKTRVYQLCHWLNHPASAPYRQVALGQTRLPLIPESILTKPPSAELRPGQVDQESLPPYDILDDILERLIEKHQSRSDLLAAGHEAATVDQVLRLVRLAEFKRKQAAPGLKVTDRAFGTGWRMPIACRWG